MIDIKTVGFEKIYDPYEIVSNYGAVESVNFIIHNNSNTPNVNIVVYFEKSETMGSVDNPATFEPYIDYSDILRMGNEKVVNSSSIGYVSVTYDGQEHIINKDKGSSKKNGISLGYFDADERKTITVNVESPANFTSRRMFVNLVAR